MCSNCVDDLYSQYVSKLGSPEEAVQRVCLKLDLYFNHEAFLMTEKMASYGSRMSAYLSRLGLRQFAGKTYDDTIIDGWSLLTPPDAEVDAASAERELEISDATRKRWGKGLTPEEYKAADDMYQTLKKSNPKSDGVQETYMKDLVKTKILQQRAFMQNNADEYTKYMKAYQDTFKNSKLKMSTDDEGDMSDENVCFGKWIQAVEEYTPADLYKKKDLFQDVDGIKEYIQRFIVRPFKNFFTGSNVPDKEYRILPGESIQDKDGD